MDALEIVVANVMVLVLVLVVLAAPGVVLGGLHLLYIDERKFSALERWNGEEHYIHRHEGLSTGLQILLSRRKELE